MSNNKPTPSRGSAAADPQFVPDCMNTSRALWAREALHAFCHTVGLDPEAEHSDGFHDLLCNFGHYADRMGLDYRAQLDRALQTWREEKADPSENGEWQVRA
jgi:hypothetical protein